jgi:hypothetical protein
VTPREHDEIVRLQQHVRELGVADALIPIFEARPDRVLRHHVVDGEVLADVAQELEVADPLEPVVVVHHARRAGGVAEVEEARELAPDRVDVALERLPIEQLPLLALPGRIADHPRGAADERQRPMPRSLQTGHQGDRDQAARVQARARRIEADVERDALLREQGRELLASGGVLHEAARLELIQDVPCRHGARSLVATPGPSQPGARSASPT